MTSRYLSVLLLSAVLPCGLTGALAPSAAGQSTQNQASVPLRTYRLVFTLTDMEGTKQTSRQTFAITGVPGERSSFKQGSRVPLATGSSAGAGAQTQITYLDIGLNCEVKLNQRAEGIEADIKLEQSGATENSVIAGLNEPIIRQSVLAVSSMLVPGQPVVIGSLDTPGGTHHLKVEVTLEPTS